MSSYDQCCSLSPSRPFNVDYHRAIVSSYMILDSCDLVLYRRISCMSQMKLEKSLLSKIDLSVQANFAAEIRREQFSDLLAYRCALTTL